MEEDIRIIFYEPPISFFKEVLKKTTWEKLQKYTNVSLRTLRAWRNGETSMPRSYAIKWSEEFNAELPRHRIFSLIEKRRSAGTKGAFARQNKFGNPGTPEGRSLGGHHAIQVHREKASSPFVPAPILIPNKSVKLAELVGAILGDGTITPYQFVLYSNSLDELQYANFLTGLIVQLFAVKPEILYHKKVNVLRVNCSRILAVKYLQEIGMQIGNKVRHQVDVPIWIKEDIEYSKACLRGLIDTDGCVYLDRHLVKEKPYVSVCIAFTNASIPLLDFVEEVWKILGFSPTRSSRDVRLRRRNDVIRYTHEVGFSNPKHAQKIPV